MTSATPQYPSYLDLLYPYSLLPLSHSTLPSMTGPVLYETIQLQHPHHSTMPSSHSHGQELMTDWTPTLSSFGSGLRREKDSLSNEHRAVASPTYSHLSTAESQSAHSPAGQSSPYSHGQTLVINGPVPTYHLPYPSLSGSHLQPMSVQPSPRLSPLGQSSTYYPTSQGDYDVFQASSSSNPIGGTVSPDLYHDQASFTNHQSNEYNGAPPLLTTTTLTRSYDSTIPSYYQTSTDGRRAWSQATTDKQAPPTKRKRGRKPTGDTAPSGNALKTPKRGKQQQQHNDDSSGSGGRASKRVRVDSAPSMAIQLPTPPSSGKEMSINHLPPHLQMPMPMPVPISVEEILTPIEEEPESTDHAARRGLVITRHQEEGRKLGLLGISQGEPEESKSAEENHYTPRTTTIPALTTDESGLASLATNEVLESEVAWFENRARGHYSPPSSPDLVTIRTPPMNHERLFPDDAEDESPETQARKIAKRLQAFSEHAIKEEQPLISTRIDMFGRVAVRKATAIKFLGLDRSAQLVEETRTEDENEWIAKPLASSSKVVLKPSWPDEEAPWALAGGSRKEKMRREESEKATLLRRYLETASDDSGSDEEGLMTMYTTYGKGKGKSVSRLMSTTSSSTGSSDRDSRRRRGVSPGGSDANALSALLISLRHRAVPVLPAGVVACVCGSNNTNGMGSMISCAACKTWHHIMCCGIEDESKIGSNWWCSSCENSSRSIMHTPSSRGGSHSTPRGRYSQLADPRSSAVKSDIGHIALAPSPMFVTSGSTLSGSGTSTRTPINRVVNSPKRPERARMLSYGSDMWSFTEDVAPPSTPAPIVGDRYSTPRIDDAPFDVTSTPSRHLDFNFGQPSLFSLTPLGGRSRVPSSMLVENTPIRGMSIARNISFSGNNGIPGSVPMGGSGNNSNLESLTMSLPPHNRTEFFRDLNRPIMTTPGSSALRDRDENFPPVSPRWPVGLLGAHNLSPSPFGHGHKRNLSGNNKLSSMRSSSRSGGGGGVQSINQLTEEKEEE